MGAVKVETVEQWVAMGGDGVVQALMRSSGGDFLDDGFEWFPSYVTQNGPQI